MSPGLFFRGTYINGEEEIGVDPTRPEGLPEEQEGGPGGRNEKGQANLQAETPQKAFVKLFNFVLLT